MYDKAIVMTHFTVLAVATTFFALVYLWIRWRYRNGPG